jgi:hypothetical protein
MLAQSNPVEAKRLMRQAQADANERWEHYHQMASVPVDGHSEAASAKPTPQEKTR